MVFLSIEKWIEEFLFNYGYLTLIFFIGLFSLFLLFLGIKTHNPIIWNYIDNIIQIVINPLEFFVKLFKENRMKDEILLFFLDHLSNLNLNKIHMEDILKDVINIIRTKYIKISPFLNFNKEEELLILKKFIGNEEFLILFYTLFNEISRSYEIYLDKYDIEKLLKITQDIIQLTSQEIVANQKDYIKVNHFLEKGDIYFLYSTKDFLLYFSNKNLSQEEFLEELKEFLIIDSIRNIKNINVIQSLLDLNRDWPFQVDIVYPDYLNIEVKNILSSSDISVTSSNELVDMVKNNLQDCKNFSYLIVGESGIGKTTFLTHLFYEILHFYRSGKTNFIPLFFELKDIDLLFKKDIKSYKDFLVLILNKFINKDTSNGTYPVVLLDNDGGIYLKYGEDENQKKRLNNLDKSLNIFLILDSLDEAYQNVKRGGLKEKKYDYFPYILSSRTNYYLENIYSEKNFSFCDAVFEIKKWKQEQIMELIHAINIRLKKLYSKGISEKEVNRISININNPLLAILFLFSYIYGKDIQNIEEISKNKFLLYRLFFITWLERESAKESSIFSRTNNSLEYLYKIFSDSAMFFSWILYNKQMGTSDENLVEILDKNLNLSIKLEDRLYELFSLENDEIYFYDFLKHNKFLGTEYDKFLNSYDNVFEEFLVSNELKSILQISRKRIDKFIHESFMEFFIAESLIRELSLDFEDIDFKILSYYYRYDITRFVLNFFEYYDKELVFKVADNLNNFLKTIIDNRDYNIENFLYQFNWAGYFLSRLLFHNSNFKNEKKDNQYIKTLLEITRKQEIPHIGKRTAYIGLITLGNTHVKEKYLSKLSKDEEFFWFNIGDVLIYYNDKKKDEVISLKSWKANFNEFLEGKINWNFTRKRFILDILDNSEKNINLREYRVKTFLHLVKLDLIGYIYRYLSEKHKENIGIHIIFGGNMVSFKFNANLNQNLLDDIEDIKNKYLDKLKEFALEYLDDKNKLIKFLSILKSDDDNKIKIAFNNRKEYIMEFISN